MPERVVIAEPLPAEGVTVPLRASFAGLKGVPLLAVGHNSISPVLRLYTEAVRFRVFRERRRPYSDIQRVGALTAPWTRNVELVWKDSILTFTANVAQDSWRVAVLAFLAGRSIPLTPAAMKILEDAGR